jgi:hypothetical protein
MQTNFHDFRALLPPNSERLRNTLKVKFDANSTKVRLKQRNFEVAKIREKEIILKLIYLLYRNRTKTKYKFK